MLYDLNQPETGEAIAVIDLAWPDGVQRGLGSPIGLMIGESQEIVERVHQSGYLVFTNVDSFKQYILDTVPG